MAAVVDELRVPVRSDADVVTARQVGRTLASGLRFSTVDLTFIATAISEVARNIVQYAERGEVRIMLIEENGRRGIQVVASDAGPGIPDVARVLKGGYSTGGSLGAGISGASRLMDRLDIESQVGEGTKVTMWKWERSSGLHHRIRELV